MDYSFVTSRLATGAAIGDPTDVEQLVGAGITHVISCAVELTEDAQLFESHPDVSCLLNGTQDDGQPKSPTWFGPSIEFALQALAAPHHKVYAHCAAGVNRGPSTCYAIMLALGIPAAPAEQMIRAARPQVGLAYKADADSAVSVLGYD